MNSGDLPHQTSLKTWVLLSDVPVLLRGEELVDIIELPIDTEINGTIMRESRVYETLGRVHTGRVCIPIIIQDEKHEEAQRKWSYWRNDDGRLEWNLIPINLSIPR